MKELMVATFYHPRVGIVIPGSAISLGFVPIGRAFVYNPTHITRLRSEREDPFNLEVIRSLYSKGQEIPGFIFSLGDNEASSLISTSLSS